MSDAVLMSAYGLHRFTHAGHISANIGSRPLLHSLQKIGPEAEVLKDTVESKGTYFYLTSVSHQKCIVLLMDLESSTSLNDHPDQSLRHYISTLSQVCLLVKLVLIGVWASLRLDQVFGIGTLCMCCWQDYWEKSQSLQEHMSKDV